MLIRNQQNGEKSKKEVDTQNQELQFMAKLPFEIRSRMIELDQKRQHDLLYFLEFW